jgi:hypothetical protein
MPPLPGSPDSFDPFEGFELISVYSRADALRDGVLRDLSDLTRPSGFRIPVAATEAVFTSYLDPSPDLIAAGQSLTGRTWDLLQVLLFAISVYPDRSEILFKVLFLMSPASSPVPIELKAICGPGDDASPVLTILLPSED